MSEILEKVRKDVIAIIGLRNWSQKIVDDII